MSLTRDFNATKEVPGNRLYRVRNLSSDSQSADFQTVVIESDTSVFQRIIMPFFLLNSMGWSEWKDPSPAEYSTLYKESPKTLDDHLDSLLMTAYSEEFIDGQESILGKKLTKYVKDFGITGLKAVATIIHHKGVEDQVAGEILRRLGYIEDISTHHFRLALLSKALLYNSVYVRDGAIFGINALGDPRAIPALSDHLGRESSPLLRSIINRVIKYLGC